MLNFVSFMECVNAPSSACLTSPGILAPFILAFVLAFIGAAIAYKNRARFRVYRGRGLWTALFLLVASLATIAYCFAYTPEVVQGVSTSATANTAWVAALMMYGVGLSLLICVGGFALGGWVVKRVQRAKA
ncbi:MAG: hypothetical protein ABL897_02485 [Hyphomicrobium sp.]